MANHKPYGWTTAPNDISGLHDQNAFIERFNKSFRVEVLDANLFNSIAEVQMAADECG